MQILYFAWVRELIGTGEESLQLPDTVSDVGQLLDFLRAKGEGYEEALANPARIRVAVNQTYVKDRHPVSNSDEIAIFPPVTGGRAS